MSRKDSFRSAFAMLDVMIAMAIIGMAITGMMVLLASGTKAQGEAAKVSTAIRLAQNIHEYTLTLNHNYTLATTGITLHSFLNATSRTPVIDASGEALSGDAFPGWAQHFKVTPLNPQTLQPVTVTQDNDWGWRPKLLSVTISSNGMAVYSQSWILAPALQS